MYEADLVPLAVAMTEAAEEVVTECVVVLFFGLGLCRKERAASSSL